MTYNGEVYNSPELADQLRETGHDFRGHSDTEVMLAAIDEWGLEAALRSFNGMFALAVWDRQERSLVLARDRIGEKPLYFAERGGDIAFASELSGLWQLSWLDKRVDRAALTAYFCHLCVPAPASIVAGARKLLPGTFYRWREGRGEVRSYWKLNDVITAGSNSPVTLDFGAAADELEHLLRDSVRMRLRADVPYGAFLSGGIDSSLVVALMQQEARHPVSTFTIGFAEKSHDESVFSDAIAGHLGTRHYKKILSAREVIDLVPEITDLHDEPFADSGSVPSLLLARFVRPHVKVAVSGDGGDELFGGYPRYFWAGRIESLRRRLSPLGAETMAFLLARIPGRFMDGVDRWWFRGRFGGANGLAERTRRFAEYLKSVPEDVYSSIVSAWKYPQHPFLADPDRTLRPDMEKYSRLPWAERMMAVDQEHFLPDDMLTKVDRATMSVGLEARAPLLDHRVVEWSWRLPSSYKLSNRGDSGKLLLREVLYRHVPRELMDRPKMGFGMPIGKWLRSELRDWAEDILGSQRLSAVGLDPRAVQGVWREHLAGTNRLPEVWTALMWVQWQEKWKARM
jgi:asparagine synthase (glutamine-hydrolysing)